MKVLDYYLNLIRELHIRTYEIFRRNESLYEPVGIL